MKGSNQRATSFQEIVEQVCKEGDVQRMVATAERVTLLCEHDVAEKIKRTLLERSGVGSYSRERLEAMSDLAKTN